uniref:CD20-like domain-containing protein n=1 Tax=Salmonella sp. s55004 TaxID=3159675 RepID=UPI00397EBBE2
MKSIFATGIFQIIGGAIMILCGCVLVCTRYQIRYRNIFDNSICGIWSGGVVLATGIVGVLAANRPVFLKGIYLCMSLVSLGFSLIAVIIGAVAAADNVHYYKEHPGYHQYDDPYYPDQHGVSVTKLSFHLILCFVGSMQMIICILAAVFCCTVFCPGDTVEQTIAYNAYTGPQTMPNYAYPPQF